MIPFVVVLLVILRLIYLFAEICFERDFPRSTFHGLLTAIGLLIICAIAF